VVSVGGVGVRESDPGFKYPDSTCVAKSGERTETVGLITGWCDVLQVGVCRRAAAYCLECGCRRRLCGLD
jgi:hypothetical protein